MPVFISIFDQPFISKYKLRFYCSKLLVTKKENILRDKLYCREQNVFTVLFIQNVKFWNMLQFVFTFRTNEKKIPLTKRRLSFLLLSDLYQTTRKIFFYYFWSLFVICFKLTAAMLRKSGAHCARKDLPLKMSKLFLQYKVTTTKIRTSKTN